jgi:rhodanese-related sulfurtransferase
MVITNSKEDAMKGSRTTLRIPAETFALKFGALPEEKKIIVYCNSGGRS